MSGGSLSQAEIDALLNSMTSNAAVENANKPKPEGIPLTVKTDEPDPLPLKMESPPQATPPRANKWKNENVTKIAAGQEEEEPRSSIELLTTRLENVEKMVRRIDLLEQRINQISGTIGNLPDQSKNVKQIQMIGEEVKQISSKLKGTLGYGAYQEFKCDECGSQHTVATVLKCTTCGHQNWRGWWPAKK
ncbi:MAG: hypothetical protein PHE50_10755 [Dehalococcoidales bacterium]|nr:hypothetical protein [Dehalococcoidales bacterium]